MGTGSDEMTILNEKTLIPLSILGIVVYVIFFIGSSYQQVNANTDNIKSIKLNQLEVIRLLNSIDKRTVRIETKLENAAK